MNDIGGLVATALGVLLGLAVIVLALVLVLRTTRGGNRREERFAREAITGELVVNTFMSQAGSRGRGWQTFFLDTNIEVPGRQPKQAFFDLDVRDHEASRIHNGARFPVKLLTDLSDVRLYLRPNEPDVYLDLTRNRAGRANS